MDIRRTLVVCIDDDLIDKLYEFVVRRLRKIVGRTSFLDAFRVIQSFKQVSDVSGIKCLLAIEQIERFLELLLGRDPEHWLELRKDIADDSGTFDALRV